MSHLAIEVHNLQKTYPNSEIPALRSLDFQVKPGEIFGLLGPNGAGKTTTFSIMCGLMDYDGGSVKIAGLDVEKDLTKIKPLIGVVPQDIALYPTLTAKENLRFFGNFYGISGPELEQKIVDGLDRFGLRKAANKQIKTYSGGMKRRLNILAGVIHSPKILFLDEPTAAVDVQSRSSILEELRQMNREGTTIVYTSHLMGEAEQFCSRVAIIDIGHKVAEGSPAELIAANAGCRSLEDVFIHLTGKNLRD
jgi:ABC-2 type transport system ATP-binding protein